MDERTGITFHLGPLCVRIEGDDLITDWAKRTFEPLESDAEPALIFTLGDEPLTREMDEAVGTDHQEVGLKGLAYRERNYEVAWSSDEPVTVSLRRRTQQPVWVRSLADPEETCKMWLSHGSSLDMHRLKEFAYTISPFAIECALLDRAASLIHASGFVVDGKGVLLPAWGGVGKSTIVSRCVLHGRAQFIADDHAVIDDQGHMHLHTLPIHVYRYHTQQDELLLSRVLDACTAGNRFNWRLGSVVRPKRLVRWVIPMDLFGRQKLARRGSIDQVVVMFRGRDTNFRWEPMEAEAAARPCAAFTFSEINGFADRLALGGAGWGPMGLPEIGQTYEKIKAIYAAAFGKAQCAQLMVPREARGDELVDFLRECCPLIDQALTASS